MTGSIAGRPRSAPLVAGRSSPRRGSAVHGVVLCAILLWIAAGCAAQLHLALRGTLTHAVDLLFDDAYYYLGVAWNLAHGHGSRFTPPLATNGYHPLWLLLLAGITALFDLSKAGLFCATLALTAAVKCVGVCMFGRGEPDAWRRTAGRIALFVALVKFPYVFSLGMETTLFIVFIPWLLALAKAPAWSDRRALQVGLVMSLVFLTRLDALALCVAVLAVAWTTRRVSPRGIAIALAPLLVTLLVYVAVNLHFFGTPVPVSGQAKAIGSHFAGNLRTAFDFVAALRWAAAMLVLAAVVRLVFARSPRSGAAAFAFRFEWFEMSCLALALAACALYYGALSGWPIWPWYLYPAAFLSVYATMTGVGAVLEVLSRAFGWLGRHVGAAASKAVAAALVAAAVVPYLAGVIESEREVRGHLTAWFFDRETRAPQRSSFNQQNVALIPWLVQRYPNGATIAMGDRAGGLGYWMPERYALLQTEGLVADKAFLRTLAAGELESYLAAQHVDLYLSDRPRFFVADGVAGFIEPVQPRLTEGALNLLCFRQDDALLTQDYLWGDDPQRRQVFDFKRRTACPAALRADVNARKSTYDGLRSYSGL